MVAPARDERVSPAIAREVQAIVVTALQAIGIVPAIEGLIVATACDYRVIPAIAREV
jgi:hypothetical protein